MTARKGSAVEGADPHRHAVRAPGGRFAPRTPPAPDPAPAGDPSPAKGEPPARDSRETVPPTGGKPAHSPPRFVARVWREGFRALRPPDTDGGS